MTITFYIPGPLRQYTGGLHKVEVDVSGSTVADALDALWQAYPGLRDRILTEQGEVRQHVNVFVGEENIRYCGGLGSPVMNRCSITLVPAVSGGCPGDEGSDPSSPSRKQPRERRLQTAGAEVNHETKARFDGSTGLHTVDDIFKLAEPLKRICAAASARVHA